MLDLLNKTIEVDTGSGPISGRIVDYFPVIGLMIVKFGPDGCRMATTMELQIRSPYIKNRSELGLCPLE